MSGWLGFGTSYLCDLGWKLIAIDRPGLGLSDPHPNKTLSSWVDDTGEFIQFNNLHNVLAVGFSQGAPPFSSTIISLQSRIVLKRCATKMQLRLRRHRPVRKFVV
jgi:pimeloyl-ACP methyl ester carboxylesterase